MQTKQRAKKTASLCWYRGADVPASVISKYARQVAELFLPESIILFGSHAYGRPHVDSDVDILVVMPTKNEIDQAVRIDRKVGPNFPLDLIVRTPDHIESLLEQGDLFLKEILSKGKVLYEKIDRPVGSKGRVRLQGSAATRSRAGAVSR